MDKMQKIITTAVTASANTKIVYFEENDLITVFTTVYNTAYLVKRTFLISNDCKSAEIIKKGDAIDNPTSNYPIFTYQPEGKKFFMLNRYTARATNNIDIHAEGKKDTYIVVANSIRAISVSYNGNKLYGLDNFGNVSDIKTQNHVININGRGQVSCFAVNNDGSIIALAYMNGYVLQFYNTKSGKLLHEFRCNLPVSYMSFNKDGSKLVAALCNNHLHIYDVELMLGKIAKDMLIRGIIDKSSNINKLLVCNTIYDYHLVGLIAGFIAR